MVRKLLQERAGAIAGSTWPGRPTRGAHPDERTAGCGQAVPSHGPAHSSAQRHCRDFSCDAYMSYISFDLMILKKME